MSRGITVGIVVVLIIVVGIGLYYIYTGNSEAGNITPNNNANTGVPETYTVQVTESGFSPQKIEIKQGDSVRFANSGQSGHWPASAVHPTHTVYPGSEIEKCGTAEENTIFDACRDIQPGSSRTFIFNEKGSWNYHDHSNPTLFGQIVVK